MALFRGANGGKSKLIVYCIPHLWKVVAINTGRNLLTSAIGTSDILTPGFNPALITHHSRWSAVGTTDLQQLLKDIPLIILHRKLLQHPDVLIMERLPEMVILLVPDVSEHLLNARLAVGEGTKTRLPFEPVFQDPFFVDPF